LNGLADNLGIPKRFVKCSTGKKGCCKPDDLIEASRIMEDVATPRLGEDQPLLVASLVRSTFDRKKIKPSVGRLHLEAHGVNVAGFSFS
jgi:hypothetical protein